MCDEGLTCKSIYHPPATLSSTVQVGAAKIGPLLAGLHGGVLGLADFHKRWPAVRTRPAVESGREGIKKNEFVMTRWTSHNFVAYIYYIPNILPSR